MESEVVAVVLPVYHGVTAMLEDLLDSLDAYLGVPYHAIVVDDHTTDGTAGLLQAMSERRGNVTVLRNAANRGWGWGLFLNCGTGMRWALEHLRFRVLLKLDHDALVIGPGLGAMFAALLREDGVGLAGTVQPEMNRWMWDLRTPGRIKRQALEHGYLDVLQRHVWSVQAGVMGFSRPYLEALAERGHLEGHGVARFGTAGLVEDYLFAVLCSACGFRALNAPFVKSTHGSAALLGTPYPIWRDIGLRAVHPIKMGSSGAGAHNASDNAQVRAYFRAQRARDRAS